MDYRNQSKKMMIITGETSGDHHGAMVVKALKQTSPGLHVYGIGGDELKGAGVDLIYHSRELSVVGIMEVFSRAPQIMEAFRRVKEEFQTAPPDLLLLIDYPDFNLRVAAKASKFNIPVLYYISPQIWAWRRGRAAKIARIVDKMAVIFPFEVPFYQKVGLESRFVGHPLLDRKIDLLPREEASQIHGIDTSGPVIGLLPGSRQGEVRRLLPGMLDAASLIVKEKPDASFILPLAPGLDREFVNNLLKLKGVQVKVIENDFYQALDLCDMAIVVSGTATLETALMEKPMVVIYKVSPFTYMVGRLMIRVDCIGIVNIVAGRKVVPELIQKDANPISIAVEVLSILENPQRMARMKKELAGIRKMLGKEGAAVQVAAMAEEML